MKKEIGISKDAEDGNSWSSEDANGPNQIGTLSEFTKCEDEASCMTSGGEEDDGISDCEEDEDDILSICSVQEVVDSSVIAFGQLSYISPAGNLVWMACNTAWANFLLMCIDRELVTLVLINISGFSLNGNLP
ncbi:uncharacterized protein LOC136068647 [Quercus suber]|uniref:uncharacterized protein LOC136068647 n=1 Tax=Quercus suber TaxID=58331 RepID=UPI0032DE6956